MQRCSACTTISYELCRQQTCHRSNCSTGFKFGIWHGRPLHTANRPWSAFGVQESALDWFSSYVSDRIQTFCQFCANHVMSRPISVTCSVPAQRFPFWQEQQLNLENVHWSGRLEHSCTRPSRHYWHQYIQKTTQLECTFSSCLPLTTARQFWACRIRQPTNFVLNWKLNPVS